jgi:hypothetical protein
MLASKRGVAPLDSDGGLFNFMSRLPSLRVIAFVILCLVCAGCGSHDASDPEYGAMFKQTTRDRVSGNEFWGSRTQKDCVSGGMMEVCTPAGQGGM